MALDPPVAAEPLFVGLTGGIAAGKSEASAYLEGLGVEVLDADVAARALTQRGQDAYGEIVQAFGPQAVGADGELNRLHLRTLIFNRPGLKRELELILHPKIARYLHQAARGARSGYVVVVVPLLAEVPGYEWLEYVVVVDAPESLQLARLMKREDIEESYARQMIAVQASRPQRLKIADKTILNDGDMEKLHHQLDMLHLELSALAEAKAANQVR